MRTRRTKRRGSVVIVLVAMVAMLAMLTPANAANGFVVAGPGAASAGYGTRPAVLQKGNNLKFINLDLAQHDVDHLPAPGQPKLFESPTIGLGKQVFVNGANLLQKGTYTFYCSIHPNMKGKLRVI